MKKKKTIELGHQGEPVVGVILRIYRQTERENSKRNELESKNKEEEVVNWKKKENSHNKNSHFSKRVSLGGSCDEVCFFFSFFFFFFYQKIVVVFLDFFIYLFTFFYILGD